MKFLKTMLITLSIVLLGATIPMKRANAVIGADDIFLAGGITTAVGVVVFLAAYGAMTGESYYSSESSASEASSMAAREYQRQIGEEVLLYTILPDDEKANHVFSPILLTYINQSIDSNEEINDTGDAISNLIKEAREKL